MSDALCDAVRDGRRNSYFLIFLQALRKYLVVDKKDFKNDFIAKTELKQAAQTVDNVVGGYGAETKLVEFLDAKLTLLVEHDVATWAGFLKSIHDFYEFSDFVVISPFKDKLILVMTKDNYHKHGWVFTSLMQEKFGEKKSKYSVTMPQEDIWLLVLDKDAFANAQLI